MDSLSLAHLGTHWSPGAHSVVVLWSIVLSFVYLMYPTVIISWLVYIPVLGTRLWLNHRWVHRLVEHMDLSTAIIQTSRLNWSSRSELWGWQWRWVNSSWGDHGKVPEKVESKVESGVPWRFLTPFQGSYEVKTIFLTILRYYLPLVCVQWRLPRAYLMCALTKWVQSSYENPAVFHQPRDLQMFKTMSLFSLFSCFGNYTY